MEALRNQVLADGSRQPTSEEEPGQGAPNPPRLEVKMANRNLDETQRQQAMAIVEDVALRVQALAQGDDELAFAFNRKISKELVYLERDSPAKRQRLKKKVWKAQGKKCPECKLDLELRYSVADRRDAMKGYVAENLEVVHGECDRRRQERKAFV